MYAHRGRDTATLEPGLGMNVLDFFLKRQQNLLKTKNASKSDKNNAATSAGHSFNITDHLHFFGFSLVLVVVISQNASSGARFDFLNFRTGITI